MRSSKLIAAMSAALLIAGAGPLEAKTRRASSAHRAKAHRGKTARLHRPARAARQAAPTAERYKQIQQVLTDKGYYAGPVNGVWGAESVEALKRFQADQKLTPDGKLGALSLIALGLGPNRTAVADAAAARPAAEPPVGP
ncbi:MAG TPA: peptidoglycan-binding domain-containing protein [Bryobacteraceae bacterium]|nr:peptidoglycan-binding domain-containing protein [Bryobacteraceae bacterium]